MPSSIFSSKDSSSGKSVASPGYFGPIVGALVMICLLLIGMEFLVRFGFSTVSRIESRTHRERLEALAVGHGTKERPSILLLGNSLLLEGVNYPGIRQTLEPNANATRFVIEQTSFLDWKYGVSRLLSEGAKPDRIVLCLNIPQLLSTSILGDYSAFYLFRTEDLLSIGNESGYDLTRTSNLLFARYSLFFAGRNSLRNFVLNRLHPKYGAVLHGLTTTGAKDLSESEVQFLAAPHLEQLRTICARHKVKFDLLLPPGFGTGQQGLVAAGKSTGTSVLVPVALNSWGRDLYRDGFHLNQEGSLRFTKLLSSSLLEK